MPLVLKRSNALGSVVSFHFLSRVSSFCTRASRIVDEDQETTHPVLANDSGITSENYSTKFHLSPLFSSGRLHTGGYDIELVDPDTWRVSSSLAQAWKGTDGTSERRSLFTEDVNEAVVHNTHGENDPDFDEIEDMRIRGNLFYKLDRDSKEFEEYNFNFRGKKSSKKKDNRKQSKNKQKSSHDAASGSVKSMKNQNKQKERIKKESSNQILVSGVEELPKFVKSKYSSLLTGMESSSIGKNKLRTPTFNQLTAPYHEPFCLDIYISKGSVRACIVHRVTSKVVVVAHSISKDMKFDLASTKDSTACAAVGGVLAQRALADDIHDVVYTPRKREKLEGKLQIVLQSIIENGVNVKVKIKQRKAKKAGHPPAA